MTCQDLVGVRFGRLVVVSRAESVKRNSRWLCRCDCGNEIVAYGGHLKSGATKSCGCLNREKASGRFKTHGKTKTRLFRIWQNMHKRCEYQGHKQYKNYGGKGIKVCKEWSDFQAFYEWAISNGYGDDLTIDRINPNRNYEPSNCQWLTRSENIKKSWRDRKDGYLQRVCAL
jgi:hypothetical protein